MSKRTPVLALAALLLATTADVLAADVAASLEKVIRLYDGPAPGSENW